MNESNSRQRLKAIITEKSYITEGEFTLASGAGSNFFFDMKPTLLDPEGATLVAEMVLDILAGKQVEAVGGLVLGACPIASAVCVKSVGTGQPVRGFYIRKEAKQRGTQKMIEGEPLIKGMRVAIVEDVTTSGGSALKAVQEVRHAGCEVACVITMVDRLQGASELFAKEGLEFHALFTREDFAG